MLNEKASLHHSAYRYFNGDVISGSCNLTVRCSYKDNIGLKDDEEILKVLFKGRCLWAFPNQGVNIFERNYLEIEWDGMTIRDTPENMKKSNHYEDCN